MTKTCSKCGEKPLSDFHFRNDTKKHRNECKACWKLSQAASRYDITFEQASEYYKQPRCLCCGVEFTKPEHKHLHHVGHKVYGCVCKDCNILLGQESADELHRLKCCLAYMEKSRKNLFHRVNQPGSRRDGTQCGPSTTRRRASSYSLIDNYVCKTCGRSLPSSEFYTKRNTQGILKPITSCKSCHIIYCKVKRYKLTETQVNFLRSKVNCDCCDSEFVKHEPYIHHVGEKVLGAVCRKCNLILQQETKQVKHRLVSCVKWIEDGDIV